MPQRLDPSDIGDVRLVGSSLMPERADCGHLEIKLSVYGALAIAVFAFLLCL